MKKIICLTISLFLLLAVFTACGNKPTEPASTSEPDSVADEKISVVTTIFPEYDWVREILGEAGDKFELTLLLDNGVDLHSFQPTAADIMKISNADLFVYTGGESDKWVDDVISASENQDLLTINLLETLGDRVKIEEVKEGMEAEEEEDDHEHENEEEPEYDEHVWLSLRNASFLCSVIEQKLVELDPEDKSMIETNAAAYIDKLNSLDAQYAEAAADASVKTLLFGDRFPFRYLADDYGLDYYAAFSGCSAESEASFETIIFLSKKVDELGLHAIMQIETANGNIAETVKSNTATRDQKILTLNSLQSMTSDDVESGKSYYSEMQNNLSVLKEALQ